jgi:hypothetical protein
MMLFNGQRPSESVRLIAHQHPIVLLPHLLIAGGFLLISIAGFAFLNTGILLSILIAAGPLLALVKIYLAVNCWKNTLVLVTTERVGFFHQKSLFKREFFECPLTTIAQVSHTVAGVGATLFGYGTVIVNTGDAESSVKIKDVPSPFDIQQEIQSVLGKS